MPEPLFVMKGVFNMEALRKAIVLFWGLVLAALAGLCATALVNHRFAVAAVDFLDRFLLYNLRLTFVEDRMIWLAVLAGVLLALLAIGSFVAAFRRPKPEPRMNVSTLDGSHVDISLSAVEAVVRRAAMQVTTAYNILSKLRIQSDGLHIDLQIAVPEGQVIPEIGAEVRRQVAEQLEAVVGVQPKQIRVEISQVLDKPEEVRKSGLG